MPAGITVRRTRSPIPGSPGWQAERLRAIFATDAAAAAGLSRFSDPHTLYIEKLGLTAPKVQTQAMRWGNIMESVIAKVWAADQKVKVVPQQRWTYWRDGLPFPMATHLDYTVGDGLDSLLEIKTAGHFAASDFGEQDTDQVPKDYLLQATHEMAVTGAKRCHLVVLVGGNDLRTYLIERDDDLVDALITIEGEAWAGIQRREPPEIDGSEGATNLLRLTQPTDDGTILEVGEGLEEVGLRFLAAKAAEKAALAEQAEAGNLIRALLGTASVARGGGLEITYRQSQPSRTINWQGMAGALAEELAASLREAEVTGGTLVASTLPQFTIEKPGNRPLLVKYKEA